MNGLSPVPLGQHGGGLDSCQAIWEDLILQDPNPAKDFHSGCSSSLGVLSLLGAHLLGGASWSLGLVLWKTSLSWGVIGWTVSMGASQMGDGALEGGQVIGSPVFLSHS